MGKEEGRLDVRRRRVACAWLALGLALLASAPAQAADGEAELTRYSIVGGCFALRSESQGRFVVKDGSGYAATATSAAAAERFRMQATDLGKYLFYGLQRDFLAVPGSLALDPGAAADAEPSDAADWTVRESGKLFTISNDAAGRSLAVDAAGTVVASSDPGQFSFVAADGCPAYPEIEVNAIGKPTTGSPLYGETSGLIDGHMHQMAFEFLGGRAHCGRPWHRFGAPYALKDCPDHTANHSGAILENAVSSDDTISSTDGWPTFEGWPDNHSLTHEDSYYKWTERAWRGGQRIMVNLLVENRVLCELYPLKQNSCDEMDSVRLQARDLYAMQDYIDAQSGGPGKGFFRIVTNPFQARRVINQGKLAVVMGMEVSEPFGCRLLPPNAQPACDKEDIDRELDAIYDLGVRQLEITNKFDNALTGVAGDSGATGAITNFGNFTSTGRFIDYEHCDDPANSDRETLGVTHNDDDLIGNGLEALLPPGAAPVYPEPPLCNRLGLSNLGVYAIRRIMEKGMVFDPDHMSVYARDQAMSLLEANDYSGVISSHSWSTKDTLERIYRLGGMVTPYAGNSEDFVEKWKELEAVDVKGFGGNQYRGLGFGADMNGLGGQGEPRGAGVANPVVYPFENWNGDVTLDQQHSGTKAYDINADGVDHYGLYPDWIEDLRQIAGNGIIRDMGRGSEAYLQMWERSNGIRGVSCDVWHGDFTGRGLSGRLRLGDKPTKVLRRSGQPVRRTRAWQWCARGRPPVAKRHRKVAAVFTGRPRVGIILSTLEKHDAGGIAPGDRMRELRGAGGRNLGHGLWTRNGGHGSDFAYRVRGGRVVLAGVGIDKITERPAKLRRYMKRSRLP